MYKGSITITYDNALHMAHLADALMIPQLLQLCKEHIKENPDHKTSLIYLENTLKLPQTEEIIQECISNLCKSFYLHFDSNISF